MTNQADDSQTGVALLHQSVHLQPTAHRCIIASILSPMASEGKLGLSLRLPPEVIESLQSRHEIKVNQQEKSAAGPIDNEEDDSQVEPTYSAVSELWDDTIAVQPQFLDDVETNSEHEQDEAPSEESDNDDNVSLGPPPSLPLVVVNLERLCGFMPSSAQEAGQLRDQVVKALSQDEADDNQNEVDDCGTQEYDSLSRHFDIRVSELFENRVAFHGDTLMALSPNPSLAVISYPEFLCRSDRSEVLVTARQWKLLLRSHSIPVVNRVMHHLAGCSRPLSWKVDMHHELWAIAKSEETTRRKRHQEWELVKWRTERRKEQLDKLYQVRETFDHRLEVARIKQERLEDERDAAAANELRRLRIDHGQSGGFEALDFETNIFSFGMTDEPATNLVRVGNGESGNEAKLDENSSTDSGYDQDDKGEMDESKVNVVSEKDEELDDTDGAGESKSASLPSISDEQRSRARRQATAKARRRRLQSQADAAQQAMEQTKLEEARAQEERVRDLCTTPELRMAQATVKSLEGRMKQVDDLLESLQEEEWADEEDGITQTAAESDTVTKAVFTKDEESSEFSLLDSVLAMILGSLPQCTDTSDEDHFHFVRKEHQAIVEEWKKHFGRLPASLQRSDEDLPLSTESRDTLIDEKLQSDMKEMKVSPLDIRDTLHQVPPATATELRHSLGIADNEDQDNWDDVDDWDSLLPPSTEKTIEVPVESRPRSDGHALQMTSARPSPKPVVGLRPGGRVSR